MSIFNRIKAILSFPTIRHTVIITIHVERISPMFILLSIQQSIAIRI